MTEETKSNEQEVATPETPELTAEQQQAVGFGWMPEEKWVEAGHAKEDWVPAKHFLKFGELKQREIAKDKQLQKQDKVIKKMKEHYVHVREQARDDALRELRAERKAALEANDLVKAEEIHDRMEETKEKFSRQPVIPPDIAQELDTPIQPTLTPPPEFYEFHERNPWYIVDPSRQDELSKEADALGNAEVARLQREGKPVVPRDVYAAVEKKIRKLYPEKFGTPKSPQQNTAPSRKEGGGSSSVKLSAEEMEVAKAFNLTPEKYLEAQKGYKGR